MTTTTPNPTGIRIAQSAAIFISASLSGASVAISAFVIPRLLESPVTLMLRQWFNSFRAGRAFLPGFALLAGANYFYLAAVLPRKSGGGGLTGRAYSYLTAGALCAGIIPYTYAVMMPTNKRLIARVEGVESVEADIGLVAEEGEAARVAEQSAWVKGEGSKYLVDRWATLNLGRAVIIAASAVLGIGATI
ncbi:hypothetical protein B0H67DRAFT_474517 [Lasiosphaeris hirsuta]|uniref:DUF1772-domain-containing protein n=1 Tax=Lasiosphaeris hirsuta TaxID=260670 RepID=A0AA40EAP3_9PEZI|nr:hypothetical protein B0H67DRAFT_474517 [Lasiosphaeris hirsuta]